MRDRYEVQTRDTCKVGAQACIVPSAEIEKPPDSRLAKVGIDEHGAVAELGERDGQIRSRRGLPFPRQGAGDQNHLWRMLRLRKENRGSQGPKGLRHLRLRQMLYHQLDAFFVTVVGKALKH